MSLVHFVTNEHQVNRFVIASLVFTLSSISACVTYKIQYSPDLKFENAVDDIACLDEVDRRLSVEKQQVSAATLAGEYSEAAFCSEPLITLLTLGLIPRVCSSTYTATLSPSEYDGDIRLKRNYETKFVAGWLALLLLPFPQWKYGYEEEFRDIIMVQIVDSSKRIPQELN